MFCMLGLLDCLAYPDPTIYKKKYFKLLSKPLSVTLKSRDPSIRISEAGSGEVEPNSWTPNVILQTHETEGSFCTINLLLQHELNRPLPKVCKI